MYRRCTSRCVMLPTISHHLCWTTTLQYPSYKKPIKTWRLMPTHPLKLNSNQTRHTQLRTRSSSSCFFPVLATPWLLSQSFKTATVSRSASPQMGVESCWREILDEESQGINYNKLPQFSAASFKGLLLVKCSHLDGVIIFTWRREEQKKTLLVMYWHKKGETKHLKKTSGYKELLVTPRYPNAPRPSFLLLLLALLRPAGWVQGWCGQPNMVIMKIRNILSQRNWNHRCT